MVIDRTWSIFCSATGSEAAGMPSGALTETGMAPYALAIGTGTGALATKEVPWKDDTGAGGGPDETALGGRGT